MPDYSVSEKPTFIILTGIHCAGKSSIGRYLDNQGYRFEEEIPQKLIDEERYEFDTTSSLNFQTKIFEKEAARDRYLLLNRLDAIIESWHLAAIAHSKEKANEELVSKQKQYLCTLLKSDLVNIHVLHISISFSEMVERSDLIAEDEGEFIEYYRSVRDNLYHLYEEFGLINTEIKNRGNLEDCCIEVENYMQDITGFQASTCSSR